MSAPAAAWAQVPVVTGVSGPLQSGGSLTITGINFGQKPVAAPVKWDNFEAGTTGSTVANGWATNATHNDGGADHPPIYSTTVLRTNSTRSVQARFDEGNFPNCTDTGDGCEYSSNFGISGVASPGLPVIFLDTWCYYSPANPESRNVKLVRVHTSTYAPNLYLNIYCFTDTDGMRMGQDGGGTSLVLPPTPWRGSSYWAGNWRHIQMYLQQSSPNVADGTGVLAIDGVTSINRVGTFKTRIGSEYYNAIWLGNYVGHDGAAACLTRSPGNTFIYWDDTYIDNTRAHVEIGNAATYAACTHTEIQIPTSWSASSITIRANQGSFASLTNTYLYVTDQNGAVNAIGLALSGSSGDLLSPAPVRDLHPTTGP
jgi:hypothetical protein